VRIAFIRTTDIQQARPTLEDALKEKIAVHEMKLFYIDKDSSNVSWVPCEVEKLDINLSVHEMSERIREWQPDVVISISLPDNNSLRDALIKRYLKEHNISVIIHPLESMSILCNKWETVNYLRIHGFDVPNSFLIVGDLINKRGVEYECYYEIIMQRAKELNYPVLVKPLWDSMSLGIKKFETCEDFSAWLEHNVPVTDMLVEEFIVGELFGIEVVGEKGNYYCQPLVKKSMTSEDEHLKPFDHVRFGPITHPKYDVPALKANLLKIADSLNLFGNVQVDMMFKDGVFYIIELNPRVSGLTNLSSSISGHNTYLQLFRLATNEWNVPDANINSMMCKAEVPLFSVNHEDIELLKNEYDVESVNEVYYHDGNTQTKMIIEGSSFNNILLNLKKINNHFKIIDVETIKNFSVALENEDCLR